GHMNVIWYVGRFDEATWNLFARIGITPDYLRGSGRGMVAVQQNSTYRRELLAGDVFAVRTGVIEVRGKVLRYVREMINGATGETAALCELTVVHLDRTTRRSAPLPAAAAVEARALLIAWPLAPVGASDGRAKLS
ncbi:MAG: thioesterase, partial [Alphaproteobacteria bacterium]|nr:thioesterase [Alphaproteobacteria bacterium]